MCLCTLNPCGLSLSYIGICIVKKLLKSIRGGKTLLSDKSYLEAAPVVPFLPYNPSYLQNCCLRAGASTLPLRIQNLSYSFYYCTKHKSKQVSAPLLLRSCAYRLRCTDIAYNLFSAFVFTGKALPAGQSLLFI